MSDIAGLWNTSGLKAEQSTSRKNNTELDMTDFLKLMVVQLQNQTIDDAMDTSEMMNQMVQMQMVTAITNMTETSLMSYASSMVGKVVTVGINNGDSLEEREILVMGTGTYNGQQVIFGHDGEMYSLKQIMAVGRLPNEDGTYGDVTKPDEPGDGDGEGGDDKVEGGEQTPETPEAPETKPEGGETPQYGGEQGVPVDP